MGIENIVDCVFLCVKSDFQNFSNQYTTLVKPKFPINLFQRDISKIPKDINDQSPQLDDDGLVSFYLNSKNEILPFLYYKNHRKE